MGITSAVRSLSTTGRIAIAGAALALLAPNARAQEDTRKGAPLVTELRLRGVRSVPRGELIEGLATRPSGCRTVVYTPFCWVSRSPTFFDRRYFDPDELRRDVLRIRLFYWQRGYREARVAARTDPDGPGVRVTLDVTEGEPTIVESLAVRQLPPQLRRRALRRSLQLREGEPLDVLALDSTVALLRDELWERGYADAAITLDTTQVAGAPDRRHVEITTRPGARSTVSAVEIEGNTRVSGGTVRRLLSIREGDVYRRSDVFRSQRDLYLSGLFSEVELELPPSGDSAKVVRLRVIESNLNQLELSSGFTNADFVQLEAIYTRLNLFGDARRVSLRGTVSNLLAAQLNGAGPFYDVTAGAEGAERNIFLAPTWATSIDFHQPWFLSSRNQLGASIFAHRRSVPGVVVDRGRGASVALTRGFGVRSSGTLGYTFESSLIEAPSDVYFCITFAVCLPNTIAVISRRNPLAPVTATALIDAANHPHAPDAGYRGQVEVEHASTLTLSDYQYNRAAGTMATYRRLNSNGVLAARVRFGWVGPLAGTQRSLQLADQRLVHPRKRFYAGGSQSVRGYGENQLGPRILTIAPEVLTDTALGAPCSLDELRSRTCDPNQPGIASGAFQPQGVGGSSLLEGSVEYRFGIGFVEGLSGAIFLDGALVGNDRFTDILGATGAVTPGFGVRFATPVGPVRLDLGVRPVLVENLPVVTQVADSVGAPQLVILSTPRRFNPIDASGGWLRQILGRLTLHLSIGPAF